MRPIPLNEGWSYRHLAEPGEAAEPWRPVTLPHDAMLAEPRSELAASGANGAWFEGRDYEYRLSLTPGPEPAGTALMLEFEGVYHRCEVWADGVLAVGHDCGYTGFLVDLRGLVEPGRASEVRVVARNAGQPNSRWYTGAGIYRPVTLWAGPPAHVLPDGIFFRTDSVDPDGTAHVRVDVDCAGVGPDGATVTVELWPARGEKDPQHAPVARATTPVVDPDGRAHAALSVPDARLWSPGEPALYECRVLLAAAGGDTDEAWATVGIRTLSWGADGLLLNGRRTLLRGACVHHDNGVLGAAAWADAEERKVALLRAQGYNALRSAHNPCSKALLAACDRQGMLVVDEYADRWYTHKTRYDGAERFGRAWRQDLADMVAKDRSHPSVVMYSTGNEVSETAEPRGVELARALTERLHELDPTRPVTCGVNLFFNLLSSVGLGRYTDEKAAREAAEAERRRAAGAAPRHRAVGSEFYNRLAGRLGAGFMKRGAALQASDRVTRDAYAAMDVAGYNYGIDRYEHDLAAYPDRLILGTETFCADAERFCRLAEKSPRLLGDFVWAGMDYLGEVGVGAWEYADYAPARVGFGWLTAGAGRIDLTGRPLGEALYTRVALGGETGPYVAVWPVNHTGERHSPSAWKLSCATDSWSWEGCEGHVAVVEVYARAERVVLLLNGREVARRRMRGGCLARMSCVWEPGTLEAVAYDGQGRELGRRALTSAGAETRLAAEVEWAGAHDGLAFVRVRHADGRGITKPLARGHLRAAATGCELLGFGCAAPYNPGSFLTGETDTYYGEALAVVRVGAGATDARLAVTDGRLSAEVALERA